MSKRKIIKIDLEKCNGCGLCIPNCPEGALQIIDGKARLISDLFCDGLGACIGRCPQGAIIIEDREAEKYDEKKVMENIVKQGNNVIKAHLEHLKAHNQSEYIKEAFDFLKEKGIRNPLKESASQGKNKHMRLIAECPGSKAIDLRDRESQLKTWPVQMHLVSASAPYLKDADLLICADCVPFAYADFHADLLKGKTLLIGCPKLDDTAAYEEEITEILKNNNVKSITCAHMEVPCCFGLVNIIKLAVASSGKVIPFEEIIVSIKGKIIK